MPIQVVFKTDNLPRVMANLDQKTHDIMLEGIKATLEYTDENVPVDTGRLKASGHVVDSYESDKSVALIYDARNDSRGDPYGRYVEFGTRFMSAQPFVTPAIVPTMAAMARVAPKLLDL